MTMGYLVNFRIALVFSILEASLHLGVVQLAVAIDNPADNDLSKVPLVSAKENGSLKELILMSKLRNFPEQAQRFIDFDQSWSPQRQDFAKILISQNSAEGARYSFTCLPDQFACADGLKCIHESWTCSGHEECEDGSDESKSLCTPPCSTDRFVCANGFECIRKSTICDGYFHCIDGSDESKALCTPPYPIDMFACANGLQCVSKSKLCTGIEGSFGAGCDDDSNNFPSACDNCTAIHLFACADGSRCIHLSKICDGIANCEDGSDENLSDCPSPHICTGDQFACANGRKCIAKKRRCDGKNDCEDGSDESLSTCPYLLICSDDQFACANGRKCIPEKWRCDNADHCEDGSDESSFLCDPPCSTDMFACADGLRCISKSKVCDGLLGAGDGVGLMGGCFDHSHILPSKCDNCSADHLFKCQLGSVDVCLNVKYKCDGFNDCIDFSDELVSECPDCVDDPSKFACRARGQMVCLRRREYQCNNENIECDDGSDEDPAACVNCTYRPYSAMCRDGKSCFNSYYDSCDGVTHCSDGSDESDTFSKCAHCKEVGSVPCPGFPGNCGKLCDGKATCPDKWDELLSTCKSYLGSDHSKENGSAICSQDDSPIPPLYQCKDRSMCLSTYYQVCDGQKDCADGSDENSEACHVWEGGFTDIRHRCDNSEITGTSHIALEAACSAQYQPLCKDGSDMDFSLCGGKCYNSFPFLEDPYRWPCTNGTKKCILRTARCDGYSDCDDGTELRYSSDEQDCLFVTRIGLLKTLLLCLALVAVFWLIFVSLPANSNEHDQSLQDPIFVTSNSDPTLNNQVVPSFLLHPALFDMDNQSWNWQEVGEQLRLEVVFFNRDPQVLFGFLSHIETQDAHPDNVYKVFKGFFGYLTSKGYNLNAAASSMKQTIGHHRLAHMALRGPPNFIDRKVFEIGSWLMELETKGKAYYFLISFLRAIQTSISPFLLNLDFVKDFILYLILRETVRRIEENCDDIGFGCLAASGIEKDILTALLVTFCVSIALTSIDSFFLRKRFFKTNFWLDLIFAIISPLLPALYHFQVSKMKSKLDKQKSKLNKTVLIKRASSIEKLSSAIQLTKDIEVGFEAILQIFLLLGLACFYLYTFKAPSGQTFSYFFGVANVVLKGNYILVFASFALSFLGPCWFYVNRTNIVRHESLNLSRKLVLMVRNVLFLLVRVFAIISAIFIPIIKSWSIFIKNQGIDASSNLGDWRFHLEFQKHFSKGLDTVTVQVRKNALIFALFLFVHLTLVAGQGIFCSAKFRKGSIKELIIYLISTLSLPLPFLTIKGVDKGEEKAAFWFLVVLHSLENFLIVFVSRLVYTHRSYPFELIVFDCVLVWVNILAVIVSVLYVTKLELYAGLPQDLPSSFQFFSLEVIFK